MDLYHFYSVIKFKYVGVTDERNILTVDLQGLLDIQIPTNIIANPPFF